jgi:hypothetical protein
VIIRPAVTYLRRRSLTLPMRNWLLVVLVVMSVVTAAACGAYRFPGPGNGSGTVSGQVIATTCGPVGPVGPVAQPCLTYKMQDCMPKSPNGPPCGVWPVRGLELVFTNQDVSLSTKTDSTGAYSMELPAGTWAVKTGSYMRIISGPETLVVSARAKIVADYVVDTGIRITAGSQSGSSAGAPSSMGPG